MTYWMGEKKFRPKFPRFNFVTNISAQTTQWQDVIQEFGPKINLVSLGHWYFKIHILYTNLEHFFFATLDCFPLKSAPHIWQGEFWSPKLKPRGSSQLDKCVEFCKTKTDFWWMMSSQLGMSLMFHYQCSAVPAWLGLKAPALAWPEGAPAFQNPRPSCGSWLWLGHGLAWPRPGLLQQIPYLVYATTATSREQHTRQLTWACVLAR